MQIYEYKIPMPDIGYNANAYLIEHENKKSILVDAGPNSPQALDALEATLKKAEVRWDNIEHILVTHGHYDHFGFVAQIVERSGALVWVHPADRSCCFQLVENSAVFTGDTLLPEITPNPIFDLEGESEGLKLGKIAGVYDKDSPA
ncbi:MBL fold metallo-hydrolase [Desulfosporosinus shakirovi]|uniref:MBL fold metallo-hydrolase n=1 Tax=Desulfosporosinus shakirovi TaxID=2885154 RepID=UPI001E60D329|nr:MBL fold metallo-hydrolase [Desulfosporosinus sp. SRJS8]MCB8817109.1 MBL fold metallo-hydrolase [Desulfosporosinus sp. SRJS8]